MFKEFFSLTGRPGVLQSMGSQRVGHGLLSEQQQQCPKKQLQVPELNISFSIIFKAVRI